MTSSARTMDKHQTISNNGKLGGESHSSVMKSTNDDVQRAIEGLKDIPDEELQVFLDDEDFMEGLDVVDAWEREKDKNIEVDQKTHTKDRDLTHASREHSRREQKESNSREKPKREEKKREETRRDPSKSSKDIERDKIRTKRDNESKLLAEKEKAIKHLLDSDNVVPPGTEAEAIQSITEKQNLERAQIHSRRSKERRRSVDRHRWSPLRRKSSDRFRLSPHRRRSPLILSPDRRRSPYRINIDRHRSPFRMSPEKRRSPGRFHLDRSPLLLSPERRRSPLRRSSWERRPSMDRRWSSERHRRRPDIHERRRSRSRDRQRSRSMDRFKRRISRSPINRRYSPRRRSRTRSRSPDRRTRKRSPFINELARQLRNESVLPPRSNTSFVPPSPIDGMLPAMANPPVYQHDSDPRPPYVNQSVPLLPTPAAVPMPGPPPFMNFEIASSPMNFEPIPLHPPAPTEYSSGPVMYNQPNCGPIQPSHCPPLLPLPVPSPQPVPAPTAMDHGPLPYGTVLGIPPIQPSPTLPHLESVNKPVASPTFHQNYRDARTTPYNTSQSPHQERMKTPEPPVISNSKHFEKTSLSSLLEASVSAKDSTGLPVLYPGFKPEILRHCEHALRNLPLEDPRLKMKGRFFLEPEKEDKEMKHEEHSSNSILLQKSVNKLYWHEDEQQSLPEIKQSMQMHQKICQTDETEMEDKIVQASVTMVDFEMQVYPHDLQQATKEEKRPIMDRLDWNMRETYDYTPKYREADDLRWSLSNSSRRSWGRGVSPRRSENHDLRLDSSSDHPRRLSRSPLRNRDSYSSHKSASRDHYTRDTYSSGYRRSMDHDEYHETRSDHSRGESPMVLEESDEDLEPEHTFHRGSEWHPRGKPFRGKPNYMTRGKHPGGRPYRGRGSFRGKF